MPTNLKPGLRLAILKSPHLPEKWQQYIPTLSTDKLQNLDISVSGWNI